MDRNTSSDTTKRSRWRPVSLMFSNFRFRHGKLARSDDSILLSKTRYRHLIAGITCAGRDDGLGAQVHAVMSALLFSHVTGIPYYHTPFGSRQAKWESVFNLGRGYRLPPRDIPLIKGNAIRNGYNGPAAIVWQTHFHRFTDKNPDGYLRILESLRSCLKIPAKSHDGTIIAVHIRRGDVSQNTPKRFTPNKTAAKYIEIARRRYPDARIRIFSQGDKSEFEHLPRDCEFELNTDLAETLSNMISADCLIMSKSSLSYIAALLSRGTIYYELFWHSPLSSWIILPRRP